MPLLYFWRGDNYRRDLDFGVGYHLNQANPLLHGINRGDSLWAFTRRGDGVYVLAAELVVSAKTLNRQAIVMAGFGSGAILCSPATSLWRTSPTLPFWCGRSQSLPVATCSDAASRGLPRCVNSVCHHRAVHRCDAPYDFGRQAFLFGETVELLADQRHALAA